MSEEQPNLSIDFSRNAFGFPGIEESLPGYYNSIIDLIVVRPGKDMLQTVTTSQMEFTHRLLAFNRMHCFLRFAAAKTYDNIIYVASPARQPCSFTEDPETRAWMRMTDAISESILPIQEMFSLAMTVSVLKLLKFSEELVASAGKRYIQWHERVQGISAFGELYRRFTRALARVGERYALGFATYALSSGWPIMQKDLPEDNIDEYAALVIDRFRNEPLVAPRLRLERILNVIEECPYLDIGRWKPKAVHNYIDLALQSHYGHPMMKPACGPWCGPNGDRCVMLAMQRGVSRSPLLMGLCGIWVHMCEGWRRNITTEKGVMEISRDAMPPQLNATLVCLGNAPTPGPVESVEMSDLIVMEGIRQQIASGSGLECPLKNICSEPDNSCRWAFLLRRLWHASHPPSWIQTRCSAVSAVPLE